MQVTEANGANPDGSIIYHSGMNPKIQRNFEVFTPCEFIAAITQHIPDKSFQLVRFYGLYSNKLAALGNPSVAYIHLLVTPARPVIAAQLVKWDKSIFYAVVIHV